MSTEKLVCTGACLFGKCPHKVCIKHQQRQGKAAQIKADMHILTAGSLPDISPDKTGYGVAVDIGTTTIVLYLYDCASATQLACVSRLNPQVTLGLDVISRIKYCQESEDGLAKLNEAVVTAINAMLTEACAAQGIDVTEISHCVITGNTTMLHLFASTSPVSMGTYPFTPASLFGETVQADKLGLLCSRADTYLTPCISSFVGGDITTAILASGLFEQDELCVLLDIGTNGEVAIGNRHGIFAASTAAGPAFEGAHISCGMAGVAGAVDSVYFIEGTVRVTTINEQPAKGICGSGLLDAMALMRNAGIIDETGRIINEHGDKRDAFITEYDEQPAVRVTKDIVITQKDIREVQTAKAAIAAGVEALLHHAGKSMDDVARVYLAGGFGNYMDVQSAITIGLLPKQASGKVHPIGNAAGTGAIMALLSDEQKAVCQRIAKAAEHIELGHNPHFMDRYIENMMFE